MATLNLVSGLAFIVIGALIVVYSPLITAISFQYSRRTGKKPFILKDPKQLIIILRICGLFYILLGAYNLVRA
jgi:hypothetical protein